MEGNKGSLPLRGNCLLEAEQLGNVSEGGPKGLEGSLNEK